MAIELEISSVHHLHTRHQLPLVILKTKNIDIFT